MSLEGIFWGTIFGLWIIIVFTYLFLWADTDGD